MVSSSDPTTYSVVFFLLKQEKWEVKKKKNKQNTPWRQPNSLT